ncbi:MAG: biotin--[acetyl-CoA-carboxylase] ligase [Bacteroidota bacterium]|nr:biotin--[acetyl-CoA-carboxylase] ligase [Bacteroidota bacterium]MDP4231234.1 biotin--[acetyl-CoA-carboxylase] ligase [Bacteroidota bacterium]MDP4235295.1 biotin--[acetyl-CoA-carboxylase] ligase [Bacteroidota bacterium]
MWNIQTFSELESTQTLARDQLARSRAKHGDVFIALHQTGGKGRYSDRLWHDEAGANLLMSVVLQEVPKHLQDKMQFVVALADLQAIRKLLLQIAPSFNIDRVKLKWTNDILIDKMKVSGILSEAIWSGPELKGVVLGIGINVNQRSFPADVASLAMSLSSVIHQTISLDAVRDMLLSELELALREYTTSGKLISALRTELEWMRSIESFSLLEPGGTKAEGLRYEGIGDSGELRVIAADSTIRTYQNATLNLL